ncbi:glycosyltransferase family 2 protein [Candidatus Woesearchaeota archaeon]|nr:glycosyltransferase family 2 protein [Candidatus Woesearchaeota archaeon]
MNFSIIVIFDQLRMEKLQRLFSSMKPQLEKAKHASELLLLHESDTALPKPSLPLEFTYLNIPAKKGIAFNRNQGIKHAKGDVIIFIDDDCWVQERWLESLLKPFEQDKSLLAVTSGTKIPPSNFLGDCIAALGFPGGGTLGFEKMWKVSRNGFTNHLAVGNCALRKEIFQKVGLFDESMVFGAEDAEFSHRLENAGLTIKYVPEGYAFHEARTTLNSFIRWHLRRGKANYHFRQKIGPIRNFVKLRLWSAKNILIQNCFNYRFPIIISLLGFSFIIQQIGYAQAKKYEGKQ